MKRKYAGVVVPMVTPFTEDGKLDKRSAIRIVDHLCKAGTIPFVLGTTGESASIPEDMKIELVKITMKHVSRGTTVFAGVSNNCFPTSVSLAKKFAGFGVDAVVAHLPSYFPLSADQMQKYFETLADKSPLPVIMYNILSTTHMSIPLNVVENLSHHPNIAGIKDSERDLERMKQLAKMFSGRSDFCIMCGWTLQSYSTLSMGFDGIVPNPANVDPQLFQDQYNFMVAGNRKEAEKLQAKVEELANIFQKDRILSSILAALKVMMAALGLCGPWVLPPLTQLHLEKEEEIRKKMKQMGLIS